MPYFIADIEFRQKARHYLTSREMVLVVFFLMFALLPWTELLDLLKQMGLEIGLKDLEPQPQSSPAHQNLGMEPHCSPKFPKTCDEQP